MSLHAGKIAHMFMCFLATCKNALVLRSFLSDTLPLSKTSKTPHISVASVGNCNHTRVTLWIDEFCKHRTFWSKQASRMSIHQRTRRCSVEVQTPGSIYCHMGAARTKQVELLTQELLTPHKEGRTGREGGWEGDDQVSWSTYLSTHINSPSFSPSPLNLSLISK